MSQNFDCGDPRLGHVWDLLNIIRQWEKNQIPPLHIRSGIFYYQLSYIRLLLMIQLQILVGDLHKGHLGPDDVIRGHQQLFANKSRLKWATDMGVVSLSFSCQDASLDMQHDLLGSTCVLLVILTWGQTPTLPIKVTRHMFRCVLTRGTRWW